MFKMSLHDSFEYLKHKLWLKKCQKSKCQFDSQPLKVEDHLDLHACKWCVAYCWKTLDEGYNFASNFTLIRSTQKKLWARNSSNFENFGTLDLGISRKMTFGCSPHR